MEVQNCTDINGVALNEVLFNDDGTVVGIIESNNTQTTSKLSCACCEAQGWTFDPNDAKCYWAASCLEGGNYRIVLDPQGNSGAFFQIDENQEGICTLELTFDWLLKFDCNRLKRPLRELLEEIELTVQIEKVIFDDSLPIPNNLETVVSETMFNIDNIFTFLDGNENTGILLNGTQRSCGPVSQNFLNDLSPNDDVVNDFTLNSDWVSFRLEITDPEILESIYNENLKVSIEGNSLANFSIVIDDVKLNRVCDVPTPPPFLDDECPKFELKRVIDNKKSWVENEEIVLRNFDLERRLTNYTINEEKLSINTKEVDIGINPSQAISDDVFENVVNNPCLLEPASACTIGTHECIDLTPLVTIPLTELEDDNELFNLFIDVKSRKTLRGYPTIDLILHRYRNAFEHCGINTNNIDDGDLDTFINLIGTYWSDLIEQLVPATTIWGSSLTSGSGSNSLSSGNNKFKYRKYSTFPCTGSIINTAPAPTFNDLNIDVITEDVTDNNSSNPYSLITECNLLSIRQIDDGSTFLGTVTIIGDGEGPTSGSTISITETIVDECNKFQKCGEFNLLNDWSSGDWFTGDWG